MGRQLVEGSPLFRQTLVRCERVLQELREPPEWSLLGKTISGYRPKLTSSKTYVLILSFVQAEYSRTLYPVCSFINSNATSMHICMVRTPFLRHAALFCSSEAEKMRAHVLATTNCRAEAFTAMPRFSLAKQLGGIISSANVALRLHSNDQHTPLKRSSLHLDHSIGQANL